MSSKGTRRPPQRRSRPSSLNSIWVRRFRGFAETGEVPLKPLTILVGENSAGKSSFLAAVRLAWDISHPYRTKRLDFNEAPFGLGAFNQIAHFRGGKAGRAREFTIGGSLSTGGPLGDIRLEATFSSAGSTVAISQQRFTSNDLEITMTPGYGEEDPTRARMQWAEGEQVSVELEHVNLARSQLILIPWDYVTWELERQLDKNQTPQLARDALRAIRSPSTRIAGLRSRPLAMAPMRTSPLRTYSPTAEDYDPEGGHTPGLLLKARLDKQQWEQIRPRLNAFGKASGMFEQIKVRTFGDENDPFQIQVKGGRGPEANLVDVGYGVSQILPILVECALHDAPSHFLLQQPEVHLHPRAQAALGSFLAGQVSEHGQRFVIETHSDHLIDRIRLEARNRTIDPKSVAIHYFEKPGLECIIHTLSLDPFANLEGAPAGYRNFFLEEQRKLISGD